MKKLFATMAAAALMMSAANAAMVTWGVNADFGANGQATGTMTFDDSTIQGLYDGSQDLNDTHVTGDLRLTFAAFGWNDLLFADMLFQPFYNITYGDGPHIDSGIYDNAGNGMGLSDYGSAGMVTAAGEYSQGRWSFDRNVNVPEPATVALLGAGLLGLGMARRRKHQAA